GGAGGQSPLAPVGERDADLGGGHRLQFAECAVAGVGAAGGRDGGDEGDGGGVVSGASRTPARKYSATANPITMASATQRTMRLVGSSLDSSGMEPNSNGGGPRRTETDAAVLPIIRNGEQARVRAPAPLQPSRRRAPALPALARQRRVHSPHGRAAGPVRHRHPAT